MGLGGRIRPLPTKPLWRGPVEEGVTQSLLGEYIVCQERFRIHVINGIKPLERFSKAMEYGSMWHVCEEAHAEGVPWEAPLKRYCVHLCRQWPSDRPEIEHWYNVCKITFPPYVDYWEGHHDVEKRVPMLQEETFAIPYVLPSGRKASLRGKFDSVDVIGKLVWLQENKTRSQVDEEQLVMELPNTLQPMFYLTALQALLKSPAFKCDLDLGGVRYNIARRPLGGGKGSIKRHQATKGSACNLKSCREAPDPSCEKCHGTGRYGIKPEESLDSFYSRLENIILENSDDFFMRWKCNITKTDLKRFQKEVLDPALENLLDWYEWMEFCCLQGYDRFDSDVRNLWFPHHVPRVFRFPYGMYNVMLEGRPDELNHYITSGSMSGMQKCETLFPELEEVVL